jgi:sugar phosphate isomerase/epimerase
VPKLSNGKTKLEAIFEKTYWLTKAGENPVEWMNRYKNRTPLIHLKDMTTDGEQFFAELGTGGVDIEAVLRKGEENGFNTKKKKSEW